MSDLLKDESLFKKTCDTFSDLYPEGPKDEAVWDRAKGDIADLELQGGGRTQWRGAITALKKGTRGITLESLLSVAWEDFPNNSELQALNMNLGFQYKTDGPAYTLNKANGFINSPIKSSEIPVRDNPNIPWQEALALFNRSRACLSINRNSLKKLAYVTVTGKSCDQPDVFAKAIQGIIEYRIFRDSHYHPLFIDVNLERLNEQTYFYEILLLVDQALQLDTSIISGESFSEDDGVDEDEKLRLLERVFVQRLQKIVENYRGQGKNTVHLFFSHYLDADMTDEQLMNFERMMKYNWQRLVGQICSLSGKEYKEPLELKMFLEKHVRFFLLFKNISNIQHPQAGEVVNNSRIYLSTLQCNEKMITRWQENLKNFTRHEIQYDWKPLEQSVRRHFKIPLLPLSKYSKRLSFRKLRDKVEKESQHVKKTKQVS